MRLEIRELSFGYEEARTRRRGTDHAPAFLSLFQGFSLTVCTEESPVAILGRSGAGKTTLLRLIAGLERPCAGSITLSDESGGAPALSMVFQEDRLLPWRTTLENVALPARGVLGAGEATRRARFFLEKAGLADRLSAYPDALSGGERRRTAIARAFAYPGALLLMDEPFQSQDIPRRIALMDLTRALLAIEHRLLLVVTHDPREALYLARRVLTLGAEGTLLCDERLSEGEGPRRYGDAAWASLEARLLSLLGTDRDGYKQGR